MRAAILFCLTFFFLLFKGYDGAHAVAPRISQGYQYFNGARKSHHDHIHFHKQANLHPQKGSTSRDVNYAEETQTEDESSDKAVVSIKQLAYFYHAFQIAWYKIPQQLALPYCKHFSYTASFKYLLLRVFRI